MKTLRHYHEVGLLEPSEVDPQSGPEHLGRLEAQLAETQAAVGELQDLLGRMEIEQPAEHRTVAPTPALAIHEVVDRADALAWWHGALGELRAILAAQGVRQDGPPGDLYATEIFEHDRGAATVFVPIEGAARAIGRVTPLVIPGAEIAVMHHHGSLANIDLTYGDLGSYVLKHEISVDGPLRENYLRGFLDTEADDSWAPRSAGPSSARTRWSKGRN